MKTWKDRIRSDYHEIRGVHHGPTPDKTLEQLDRELTYADRLNINSVRMGIWEEHGMPILKVPKSAFSSTHGCAPSMELP